MGDDGGPFAGDIAHDRCNDDGVGLLTVSEGLEIFAVCDVDRRDLSVFRPVDEAAIGADDRQVAHIGQAIDLRLQHLANLGPRHARAEGLRRVDRSELHAVDRVRDRGVGILELLREMPAEQQDGIFELALIIADRAVFEAIGHHKRSDHDGCNEERATGREPRHRTAPDRRAQPRWLGLDRP